MAVLAKNSSRKVPPTAESSEPAMVTWVLVLTALVSTG